MILTTLDQAASSMASGLVHLDRFGRPPALRRGMSNYWNMYCKKVQTVHRMCTDAVLVIVILVHRAVT